MFYIIQNAHQAEKFQHKVYTRSEFRDEEEPNYVNTKVSKHDRFNTSSTGPWLR